MAGTQTCFTTAIVIILRSFPEDAASVFLTGPTAWILIQNATKRFTAEQTADYIRSLPYWTLALAHTDAHTAIDALVGCGWTYIVSAANDRVNAHLLVHPDNDDAKPIIITAHFDFAFDIGSPANFATPEEHGVLLKVNMKRLPDKRTVLTVELVGPIDPDAPLRIYHTQNIKKEDDQEWATTIQPWILKNSFGTMLALHLAGGGITEHPVYTFEKLTPHALDILTLYARLFTSMEGFGYDPYMAQIIDKHMLNAMLRNLA